ncbi:hypothetical protein [Lysinibacillus boronitolerans]|uniref:hypothetical protein n=1 Tax=Lysinibacillus boronitolerans TaxID=309788 RepID=UPI00386212A9
MNDVRGNGGIVDRLYQMVLPLTVLVLSHVGVFARFLQDNVKAENIAIMSKLPEPTGCQSVKFAR